MASPFIPSELSSASSKVEFGITAHTYTDADHIHYQVSEQSLALLALPEFRELVSHALQLDPADASTHGSLERLKLARDPDLTKGIGSTGSVFGTSDYIVKHSRNLREAQMQFGLMGLLSQRLDEVGGQVGAPAQHLLAETSDTNVTIMERRPGTEAQRLLRDARKIVTTQRSFQQARAFNDELKTEVQDTVRSEVSRAVGGAVTRALLNDLVGKRSGLSNVLISGASAADIAASGEFPSGTKFTILDQPSILTKKDRLLLPHVYALLASKK